MVSDLMFWLIMGTAALFGWAVGDTTGFSKGWRKRGSYEFIRRFRQ